MELRDRSGSLDYINHAGQDLLRKVSSGAAEPSSKKLFVDLQNLNSRWNQLQTSTDERINKYFTIRDQLRHLKVCHPRLVDQVYHGITSYILSMFLWHDSLL